MQQGFISNKFIGNINDTLESIQDLWWKIEPKELRDVVSQIRVHVSLLKFHAYNLLDL